MKRVTIVAVVLLAIVGAGALVTAAMPYLSSGTATVVPTARVTKGPLQLTVHAAGDLRAGRTTTLVAPPVGGALRLVRMLQTGTTVTSGDIVAEFDPADQQFALEQARSEVAEAEQEIAKMKADRAAQQAQDEVDLLTARFAVRRAELDASANELVPAIEAEKNRLTLEEARRALEQLEEDVKSRAVTSEASMAVAQEKRNKATLAMQRAQQVIDSLVLRAPLDGVVSVKENRDAMGGIMIYGMAMPEYREGDSVFPGRPVVDVIESGRMEVRAKVDEGDRANLTDGQPAVVEVDALPGETFAASVGELAGLANRGGAFESSTATRLFDVTFQFDRVDSRMKAGGSARVTIEGRELSEALTLPRQAVFQKNGKTWVRVKAGERFDEREITVVQRTESRVLVEGVPEGTEVALVDPASLTGRSPGGSASPVAAAGAAR